MPPEDLLIFLNDQIPRRQLQIRQLTSLLDPALPNPSILVIHGLEATGKSLATKAIVEALGVSHAIIPSRECITSRHLLERTVAACRGEIQKGDDVQTSKDIDGRCDNISALVVQLQSLFEGGKKFVLVFDGIDRQREAPPGLLPAIARLGEIIPTLTIILIVTAPRPRFLHLAGVPHIHFLPYDRTDSIAIVSRRPLNIYPSSIENEQPPGIMEIEREEDDMWLWSRFCGAVWDSLGKGAARDIVSFRNTCERLWLPFVQPIRDGIFGTRDFSKLLVRNRGHFQIENALIESIVPVESIVQKRNTSQHSYELPYYSKFLLISAFLASYNPARQDQTYFMKSSEKKRRKKGSGTVAGRPSKHRKIQRKLLGPQAFVQERLLAIFHSIVPHRVASGTADIMTQIATLVSLRLLVKASGMTDVLDAGTKWKVNVSWEFVKELARSVRFDVESYLAE